MMKYLVAYPYVTLARVTLFAAKPFVKQRKKSEK